MANIGMGYGHWSPISITGSTSMTHRGSPELKVGDTVRVIGNSCMHGANIGDILFIRKLIPNGIDMGSYWISCDDVEVVTSSSVKKKPEPKQFDLKHLEPLVIGDEVKDEIIAVLKQHKHSTKLFKEWGLDEVLEYGKGMTFMFYGPPGTGKTWAATCIAKVFGRELLSISAAEIQTSEPGGANRNIVTAFETAKKEDKILLLDECDSLITSRNDVGMVLGSEINTLLTQIEKYEGVCILATNRIDTMDEALERRISLIVEFPEPVHGQRHEIWKRMIPKKMPLASDVNLERLADHKLTGGQIKNAVLQAARLAVASESKKVELAHFELAISRINKSKSLMGTASRYSQHIIRDIGSKMAGKTRYDNTDILPSTDKTK